ncbi:MAG: hypothetical protein [Microvirus sp.]|nr:MAG: hypothetical protein [Microvirus sp.]
MRHHVNKHRSAAKFRSNVGHTKAKNVSPPPQRGGIRL